MLGWPPREDFIFMFANLPPYLPKVAINTLLCLPEKYLKEQFVRVLYGLTWQYSWLMTAAKFGGRPGEFPRSHLFGTFTFQHKSCLAVFMWASDSSALLFCFSASQKNANLPKKPYVYINIDFLLIPLKSLFLRVLVSRFSVFRVILFPACPTSKCSYLLCIKQYVPASKLVYDVEEKHLTCVFRQISHGCPETCASTQRLEGALCLPGQ